ncbi:MFS transporter [Pseudaminobacter sp. 19-2017]|uniref:MFS transporter n=1 Tax=Pseudaminobacter soli (ex Zhang et al. 2022) TaxID=2831468 RepID=A0A942I3G8_9HYPH|nr:MFS transporter [Pseudaminobacter soli]
MADSLAQRVDWRALWASGDLFRFCFISLGILLHSTNETMVVTILPALVRDLASVQLVGWAFAVYELGAIIAGAAGGRLTSYISLRATLVAAALVYSTGALICATAPDMPIFLAGRLVAGLGGGALVALAFVSVERLFPRAIWPQLFGVISAIWGVAAFSGPLIGALFVEHSTWRWGFATFVGLGLVAAVTALFVLRGPQATRPKNDGRTLPPFPYLTLGSLAASVILIATAGVGIAPLRSSLLLAAGMAGIAVFFMLDARVPAVRLFPSRPLDPRTPVGNGITMVAAFSLATCSFAVYGPIVLQTLHGVSVLSTGYIIVSESIAWSVLSIVVAGAPPHRERSIVLIGALMIAGGLAGFAWAVPAGNIPAILFCAILQGGGFGMAWPFVTRIIVAAAPPSEQTVASSAVPTMQRTGYAVGAASCGIIANVSGFSHGLSGETAAGVASWLFIAYFPLAALGCIAAWRLTKDRSSGNR